MSSINSVDRLANTSAPVTQSAHIEKQDEIKRFEGMTCPCGKNCGSNIPNELRSLKQFVVWKYKSRKTGKPAKIPYSPIGQRKASSTDESTWSTLCAAIKVLSGDKYNGLGFVLHHPFVGIDLDNCRNGITGEIDEWAWEIILLIDSYTEVSPSGTGIHILAKGALSGPGINRSLDGHKVEIYNKSRYFTLTGQRVESITKSIEQREKEISHLYEKAKPPTKTNQAESKPKKSVRSALCLDDEKILEIAKRAKNRVKFEQLFNGNWSGFTSQSEADLALCSQIAFYTQDPTQIDRLFRHSGLNREKWEQRADYRNSTIEKAIGNQTATYNSLRPTQSAQTPPRKSWLDKIDGSTIKRIQEGESSNRSGG